MNRTRLRTVLVLAGLLPAVVALAFAAKVVVMLSHDAGGRGAYGDGDFVAAAEDFSANGSLNWFEPWIAAFDEGAARHADDDLDGALRLYAQALEDVPAEHECTVRINEALAHETLGDRAAEEDDADEATSHWQAGIDTLAEGDCPTDAAGGEAQTEDAAAVDQRLRHKQEQQQQQPDDPQNRPDRQPQTPEERREQREQERKERRLEERNDEAIEEKKDYDEDNRDRDYSEYHW